jgi:hypothetical protein
VDAYMGDGTTHVLSDRPWDNHFDHASANQPGLVFVRPSWIDAVHRAQRAVPTASHVIVRPA